MRVGQVAHEAVGCYPWGYRLRKKPHRKPVGLSGLYARLHSQLHNMARLITEIDSAKANNK